MKKSKLHISAIILLFVLISACQKEDWTYKGAQYYEFSAYENNQRTISNILNKENSKIGLDSICIQLIKPSEGDVIVNYKIVKEIYYLTDKDKYVEAIPAGTNLSLVDTVKTSAIIGTDYEIVTTAGEDFSKTSMSGTITIPKGKYFGYVQVRMLKKTGNNFFVVLKDSPSTMANKPTSILNYVIAPERVFYLQESFMDKIPDTWTLLDKDGDGYNWNYYKGAATSDSYLSGTGALTPENYMVSPLINIGKTTAEVLLTFDVKAGDPDYPKENYRVIVSESPITLENCRQSTLLRDWRELDATYSDYKTETINLTAYKGRSVYIGFVHGNCTDCYYILVKNVKIFGQ